VSTLNDNAVVKAASELVTTAVRRARSSWGISWGRLPREIRCYYVQQEALQILSRMPIEGLPQDELVTIVRVHRGLAHAVAILEDP